ncbi:woronin body major protein [Cladophialophora bantiana CBS 173.52]|uniref:Woronin body major protein n=1 Tax=Cladophialophora bantiana (strain ATCC 10958 / CBS 173.52 / CDC B-1940 / NIH 8579) TaxID=1442370 RepID=A0A0D2EHV1_CLAB1|nr:woronin body major protein [Cladophialophora bantiana CBS 173.52]KIW89656.1 woronin body major protein [Cladophialophora bantiana CBS 173.52]
MVNKRVACCLCTVQSPSTFVWELGDWPQKSAPSSPLPEWEKRVEAPFRAGNLDFDARVPIPISVFPSTYRSDASAEETTVTKVEGEVQLPRPSSRVGREDTRFSKQEVDISVRDSRPRRDQYQREDVRVYEERDRRYPEVELTREKYRGPTDYKAANVNIEVDRRDSRFPTDVGFEADRRDTRATNVDIEIDRRDTRDHVEVDYDRRQTYDKTLESQLDITEREYRRRVDPTYDVEYERRRPVQADITVQKQEIKVDQPVRRRDMGYYDDDGNYHSFRRGVERAADRIMHPFTHHQHHRDGGRDEVVVTETRETTGPTRVRDGSVEQVRFVEPRFGGRGVPIQCHFIRIGDILLLQGRPSQVIRISMSSQTGQYRYLGVDLFTRQLHEESSFISNPAPSVVVQTMLGPVFKQYRVLDIREDGLIVCMTESGDVKQGLPVIDQGGLFNRIDRAFADGRGSVRVLVINDGGRELIVDMKIIHGSRL